MAAGISANIGAGQTYTTIQGWIDAQPNDPDAGTYTGTIVDASAFNESLTCDVPNANGCTFVLTADTTAKLDAPSWASATANARVAPSAYQVGITISQPGWVIEKISVVPTTSGGHVVVQANATLRRCLFKALNQDTVQLATGSVTLEISNCVILGTDSGVILGNGTLNAYQTSVCGTSLGFYRYGGTGTTSGCIVQAASSTNWLGTWSGDFNVSQDATAPGSASTKYARNETGWYENPGSTAEDLALVSAEQGWWAANKDDIDQTGWPADVATDIVGTTRTGAVIDPGCWQTPAAAATGNPWYYYANQ